MAAAKLDQAESYEKRTLSLIAAMKKPRQVTAAEFENSQASLAWRAHSGLGTVYFRRKDFADSASELQIAIKQEGSEADPTDLYVLGIDLENFNRLSDAADDFAQCSVAKGDMQQTCQQAYERASDAVVETAEKKAYDPSALHFEKVDAKNDEQVVLSAALFDTNGNYVTGVQKSADMGLDDATLAQLEKTGFYVEMDLDVKPGNYVLRTVARDSNDRHISAQNANIDVPN